MINELQREIDERIIEIEQAKELYARAKQQGAYKAASDYAHVIEQLGDKISELSSKIQSYYQTNY